MSILTTIKKAIKGKQIRIVFPDGHEPSILQAGALLVKQNLAIPYFIGDTKIIEQLCKKHKISMRNFQIRDPYFDDHTEKFAEHYYTLRKHKGISKDEAKQMVMQSNYFGTMLLKYDVVDGVVSGYNSTTKPFLPAFHIIGTEGVSKASSYFLMIKKNKVYLYADCGLVIDPNSKELSEIALTTAKSAKLLNIDPVVAMLSFSTKGSANHELVNKVRTATVLAKKQNPSLAMDGEIQFDAAFDSLIAKKKHSSLTKPANIFIFPNLDAGNIAYKITERLAGFTAIGPLLQGLKKPVNDMSRGASVKDIVDIAIITCYEALH